MSVYLPDINSEKYKEIYKNVETRCGIVTRMERGHIACKTSQLMYIIIALLWKYIKDLDILPKKKLLDFTKEVNRLYDICVSEQYPAIRNFSLNGQPINPFTQINDTRFLDPRIKIYTMGLVHTNNSLESRDQFPNGVINHFFLIIKIERTFYIISSYGSDIVMISQKMVPLDLSEFQNIINAFNGVGSIQQRNRYIIDFFYKYFLPDGMTTYSIDEGTDKKLVHPPKKGASLEVSDYLFKESDYQKEYKFFYFPEFVDNIAAIISSNINEGFLESSGGKKIKRTKKTKRYKEYNSFRRRKLFRRNKTAKMYQRYKK